MAFNTEALENVASQYSKEVVAKAVAEAKTAKLLINAGAVTAGVKGSAVINKMDADVTFQDGDNCGRNPLGSVTLSDKRIYVKPIKDQQNFCGKALYDTYFAQMLAQGQDPESELGNSAFIKSVMNLRASKVSAEVEKLLWKGDTALTGANNMKWIDGILKQVSAEGNGHIALTPTGSDIIAKLQSVVTAMPIDVSDADDFRIFIGKDTFNAYVMALAGKNIFKPTDDFTIFGTTAKLEVVPGLNGTNAIVAAKISDLHLGIDGISDEEKAILKYSVETEQWYQDFRFAVGVAVVYPEQVGYGTLA